MAFVVTEIIAALHSNDPARVAEGVLRAEEFLTSGVGSKEAVCAVRDALLIIADADAAQPAFWRRGVGFGKARGRKPSSFFHPLSAANCRPYGFEWSDVWQAMVALSEMEPSLRVSGGIRDFERNFTLATEFLRAHASD